MNSADSKLNRRAALKCAAVLTASMLLPTVPAAESKKRRWSINLMPGMIGVSGDQLEIIGLAARHGFESVEPQGSYLAKLEPGRMEFVKGALNKLTWGAAGLPVDFRGDDAKFNDGIAALPQIAQGLQRAGVSRVGTWLSPASNTIPYVQNMRLHQRRLGEIAKILGDAGLKLGLEYVGTATIRNRMRYSFVRTMAETKELIAEIGRDNVGFVLDSWHWWQAGDSAADIMTLKADQVVAVDLNDAPKDIPKDQQIDGKRELPLASGVIDVKPFLQALLDLGYDGPVRAEPFNKVLNDLDNEEACRRTGESLRKAAALL